MAVSELPPHQEEGGEQERLRFALQAAGIGTWDINLRTGVAWWDQRTQELYGFSGSDTRAFKATDQLMIYVHELDQARLQQAMAWALKPESGGCYSIEFRINRRDNGQTSWVLANGQAYFDEGGQAYRFSGTLQDITQAVLVRQRMEEAREELRGAIELAQLGTWQYDLISGQIEYSARLRAWHGLGAEEPITAERAFEQVDPVDGPRVRAALQEALTGRSDGHFNLEYRVTDGQGFERILHSQGKAYVNPTGQAYKISGTVREVTQQRAAQFALEQQVTQRTQQLEASIDDLRRSNQNLEQFAYIASHDLQEPLRKIQQFGDLLIARHAVALQEGVVYLERMQAAARRMSTLVRDLLTFSRIATQRDASGPESLADIVRTVLLDLDVLIEEAKATIVIGPLPTLEVDRSQLEQLFLNLLSNALKFRRPGVAPHIEIRAGQVVHADLPPGIAPKHVAPAYHRLDVVDNGVGFEERYLDRIFQVFQRLHGKNEFAGTGIGLAICEKVVANHGGAITAQSQLGHGSIFSIFLPL